MFLSLYITIVILLRNTYVLFIQKIKKLYFYLYFFLFHYMKNKSQKQFKKMNIFQNLIYFSFQRRQENSMIQTNKKANKSERIINR